MMNFERIDRLITTQDFFFQSWNDRYARGVWVALGLHETQIDTVRDLSSDGDLDMIPAMEYVRSADWLPYVTGSSLAEAMQQLEDRLARLPQDQLVRGSQWADLVYQSVHALHTATDGKSWYDDKNKPDMLANLPATFELAVLKMAQADENCLAKSKPNPA
jgi:hypothetical protein